MPSRQLAGWTWRSGERSGKRTKTWESSASKDHLKPWRICRIRRRPRTEKSNCVSLGIQQQTDLSEINGKTVEPPMRLLKDNVRLKNERSEVNYSFVEMINILDITFQKTK